MLCICRTFDYFFQPASPGPGRLSQLVPDDEHLRPDAKSQGYEIISSVGEAAYPAECACLRPESRCFVGLLPSFHLLTLLCAAISVYQHDDIFATL